MLSTIAANVASGATLGTVVELGRRIESLTLVGFVPTSCQVFVRGGPSATANLHRLSDPTNTNSRWTWRVGSGPGAIALGAVAAGCAALQVECGVSLTAPGSFTLIAKF